MHNEILKCAESCQCVFSSKNLFCSNFVSCLSGFIRFRVLYLSEDSALVQIQSQTKFLESDEELFKCTHLESLGIEDSLEVGDYTNFAVFLVVGEN